MKKFLLIMLAVIFCLSLIACGANIESRIESAVNQEATWRVRVATGNVPTDFTYSIEGTDENEYKVTGSFTIGSKRTSYAALAEYDSEDDVVDVYYFDWD